MTTSKRAPGPFSFCTKHPGAFYATCKCPIPGSKKKAEDIRESTVEKIEETNTLDV